MRQRDEVVILARAEAGEWFSVRYSSARLDLLRTLGDWSSDWGFRVCAELCRADTTVLSLFTRRNYRS